MTTPTERPWHYLDTREVGGNYITISDGKQAIARIKNDVSGRELTDEDLANATHIVKCVNAYDGLVKALELIARTPSVPHKFADWENCMKNSAYVAKQALAAAKGVE